MRHQQRRTSMAWTLAGFLAALALALLLAPARAQLTVTNLIGFAAKPVAVAGGGTPVVFQAGAAYVDGSETSAGLDLWSFTVSHTKDADATMVLVAVLEPGENDNTAYITPGTGLTVTYCGSPMTYVTGSQVNDPAQFEDNDRFDLTWWWLRGPTAGACDIVATIDEKGTGSHEDGNSSGSTDPPANVVFAVMEFSDVISSGDPYEGVATVNGSSGSLTGTINLTPTAGRMAVWGAGRDGSATIAGAAPIPNFGSVDANIGDTSGYHLSAGHYDAVGAKSIIITWGSGVTRIHVLSGFHLKPN